MVKCYLACLFRFCARLMVVAALIKSGLDVVLINQDTPRTIVQRSHILLSRLQECIYID